jgi:hypothetical protein
MENVFDVPKNFVGGGGGGGRRNKFVPQTIFWGLAGHNPKKSGKFISAPLIFSFPYAHARVCISDTDRLLMLYRTYRSCFIVLKMTHLMSSLAK